MATTTIAYLEAIVGADISNYRRQMSIVRNETGLLADQIGGLGRLGQRLSFALTLPMAIAGAGIVKTAADFEASMRNIASISDDVSNNFDEVSRKVLEFGANTRSGAQAAADALYEVFSAGYAGDAFELMQVSVMTAEAGLADLTITTRALTSTLNAYSKDNVTAAHASDVLTRTVQVGVGTMGEFASSLGRVAPLAAALNIPLEELGANWAFITQRGASAGTAATELYGVMSKLLKPTEDLQAAFGDLGVTSGRELIGKFGGLQGALLALYETFGESEDVMAAAFGNERAIRGLLKIINDVDAWNAAISDFNDNLDQATEIAWAEQMQSFAAAADRFLSAIQAVAIHIGTVFLPLLTPLVNGLTDLVRSGIDLDEGFIQVAGVFAVVAAAAGPLIWIFSSLLTPIGVLVGAVAALATAFAVDFQGIRTSVANALGPILGDIAQLTGGIQTIIDAIFAETAPDAIQGPVDRWAEDNQATIGLDQVITVKEGDTLWDIFNSNEGFKDAFSWEEFKAVVGLENPNLIRPGDIITIPQGAGAQMTRDLGNAFRIDPEAFGDYVVPVGTSKSFGERLSDAASEAWPEIQTALGSLFEKFKNWVLFTGIPDASFALGNIVGTVGNFIGQILGQIAEDMKNAEGEGLITKLWNYFGEYVWRPFVEGIESAIPTDTNVGNAIVTAIAGAIGVAFAGKIIIGALTAGIGTAITKAFSVSGLVLGAKGVAHLGSAIINLIATHLTGMTVGQLIKTGLVAAIGSTVAAAAAAVTGAVLIGTGITLLIPEEVKEAFRNTVNSFFQDVFGVDDFNGRLQAGIEATLYNTIGHIAGILGDTEAQDNLYALGEEAGNRYAGGLTYGVNTGLQQGAMPMPGEILRWEMIENADGELVGRAIVKEVKQGMLDGWRDRLQLTPGRSVVESILPTPEEIQSIAAPTGTSLADSIANAANTSIQEKQPELMSTAQNIVDPFIGVVDENMSEGGPILTKVDGFASSYVSHMDAIALASEGIGGTVDTGLGALFNSLVTWAGGIITRVNNIATAFRGLVEAATGASNLPVPSMVGGAQAGRAIGGPVRGGVPYLVGEYGPEIFIPQSSGSISNSVPMSQPRGSNKSGETVNNFYIYGVKDIDGFISETKRRGWKR